MSAPDRSAEVATVVNAHPELVGSDDIRRGLLYWICVALNRVDDGNWGVLVKTDQDGKVPYDVIVWAPTREHFDVIIGNPHGPAWQPKGVLENPAWLWMRATTLLFAPGTGPADPTDAPAPSRPPAPSPGPAIELPSIAELFEELHALVSPIVGALEESTAATLRLSDQLAQLAQKGVKLHW